MRTGLLALLLATGCGSYDPSEGNPDSGVSTDPLLPWNVGNRWTYRIIDNGIVSTKETTVGALEAVGGTGPNAALLANKVITLKGATDKTISWQLRTETGVVRYREQAFQSNSDTLDIEEHWSPHKLHVDETAERTEADATWVEIYEETKLRPGAQPSTGTARDRWTVTAVNASVTVPAGTFEAVVLQKAGGATSKTYWYVRGVGKVKEEGGQTEELISYEVQP